MFHRCRFIPVAFFVRYTKVRVGPITGLIEWTKRAGTGKNENLHGFLNPMVHGVARLTPETCDSRLLPRIIRHNLNMDRKHGRRSNHSTPWPWRERDLNDAARSILDSTPFPKAGPRPQVSPAPVDFDR